MVGGGDIEIVHINRVSVLGRLNLEKMPIFSFTNTVKHTKPLVIKTFQECFLCYNQSQQRQVTKTSALATKPQTYYIINVVACGTVFSRLIGCFLATK